MNPYGIHPGEHYRFISYDTTYAAYDGETVEVICKSGHEWSPHFLVETTSGYRIVVNVRELENLA